MKVLLNSEQSQFLAHFFFDIGKGLVLGGIGFATVVPLEIKVLYISVSLVLALWTVRLGLSLLE